jgi:radical SAM superfamily enzyme YgiQ (UPF0313 family)
MKKNIALIRPNYDSHIITPQLGIGYLSSYLKVHGYDVLLIDALRDRIQNQEIFKRIKSKNVEVVGITCLSAYYNEVVALSRYLKNNNIQVIIGGVHPTFMPYKTLLDSNADFVVCGEGEAALLSLLENNMNNTGIGGVYALSDLTENTLPERADSIQNLNDIPFPDWEQMPPGQYPKAPHGALAKRFPIGLITSSRGCPYSCKFCSSPNFYGKKIRFRSPENVINEMKYLIENFGVKEIQFEDDNITMNRKHIEAICNLIIENNIKVNWSCPNGIRADRIDEDIIKLMRKAGCYYCALGIESGNAEILKNIDKKETLETIQKAIKIITRNGIICQGFFIVGLPGETKSTIKETINFALKSGLDRAQFCMLDILPGCKLWTELIGEYVSDFSKKSFKEPEWLPKGLTKKDLLKAQSVAFRKFYMRPKTFFRTVRYIKPRQIVYLLKRLFDYRIFFNFNKK